MVIRTCKICGRVHSEGKCIEEKLKKETRMKAMIFEDNPSRLEIIKEVCHELDLPVNWCIFNQLGILAALRGVIRNEYDVVFLDCNLGLSIFSGGDIACMLSRFKGCPKVIVHCEDDEDAKLLMGYFGPSQVLRVRPENLVKEMQAIKEFMEE